MTEKELQAAVLKLSHVLGYMTYHTFDSRRSQPGFPDLVLVRPHDGRLLMIELKSARGRLTPEQEQWVEALTATRAEVYVFRPSDWTSGKIEATLMSYLGLGDET